VQYTQRIKGRSTDDHSFPSITVNVPNRKAGAPSVEANWYEALLVGFIYGLLAALERKPILLANL
jgi:hypothetical protein